MQSFNKNTVENNLHITKRIRLNSGQEHEDLISAVNEVLGLNSWSHSIIRRDIDYIDNDNGSYSVGISVIVKVELKNGIFHEGLGFGSCNGSEDKGNAISLAQQDAVIQGMREALSSFGGELAKRLNPSQNCRPPEVKVGSLSPTGTVFRPPVDTSPSTSIEDEIKLERKRRQQKKREEFLLQMKQKQLQLNGAVSNKENTTNTGRINSPESKFMETLDMDDEALISTQEMDRMVQSAVAQPKPRMPLISSPTNTVIETARPWLPTRPNKVNTILPRNKNPEVPYKTGIM